MATNAEHKSKFAALHQQWWCLHMSGSGEEDFQVLSMYFLYLSFISPWTNLNLLHPTMLCAKFCWNWPSGFGEEDFFKDIVQIVQKDSFIRNSDSIKSFPIWCPRYWYSNNVIIYPKPATPYVLCKFFQPSYILLSEILYKTNRHVKKWVHKYKWTHVTWPSHNSRSLSERLVYSLVFDPETISNIHLYYLHISWTDIIYKL